MNQGKRITIIVSFIVLLLLPGLIKGQATAGICPTPPCVDSADIQDGSITGADIYSGAPLTLGNLIVSGGQASPLIALTSSFTGDVANRNWAVRPSHNAWGNFEILQSNVLGGNPVTAGTSRFVISPVGNVGIGTTTPGTKLQVSGGTLTVSHNTNMDFITLSNLGTYGRDWRINSTSDGSPDGAGKLIIRDDTVGSGSVRLAIDSSGNVGIGTTVPGEKLEVAGNLRMNNSFGLRLLNGRDTYVQPADNTSDAHIFVSQAGLGDFSQLAGNLIIQARTQGTVSRDIIFAGSGAGSVTAPLVTIKGTGKVGIGTTNPGASLHVAGDVIVDGNIAAKYQDVAEWVPATLPAPTGTVVILDLEHSNGVTPSINAYDTKVAGVVSNTPGILLGESGEGKVKVATTGRVKVKVDASHLPIRVGDLLVTGDKEGMAMRSEPLDFGGTPIHRPGTILGKALEPLSEGMGEILVLLTLQ